MLERHWVGAGYTAPNADVYPWQWLWDSCFHALVWHALGETDRALTELGLALSTQDDHGFVPHMNYQLDPKAHAGFWGREATSSITQPPMYGHAIAELIRTGVDVEPELVMRAHRGLRFLLDRRARHLGSQLILLCHPWETGADNSARWDHLCEPEFSVPRWRERKGELVDTIIYDSSGSPIANPRCEVASVSFNALVAFNALELADVAGFDDLRTAAGALAGALDTRYDAALGTWIDAGVTEASSGRARTTEALLALLVTRRADAIEHVFAALGSPAHYGARCGPAGAHRDEPTFRADEYWRGATWPQINYLLWVAARRHDRPADARAIAQSTLAGARSSQLAEYWHPDDGRGLGAIPQSWTGLALLVSPDR